MSEDEFRQPGGFHSDSDINSRGATTPRRLLRQAVGGGAADGRGPKVISVIALILLFP